MRRLIFLVCVSAFTMGVEFFASAESLIISIQERNVQQEPLWVQSTAPEKAPEQKNIENGTRMEIPVPQPSKQLPVVGGSQTVVLSRFSFQHVDDGLLRLDGQTGEVALCSPHKGGWTCENVPESNAALEKETKLDSENIKLRAELMRLKAELSELQSTRQSERPPADLAPHSNDGGFKLRIDNNVERLRVGIENIWRRMMTMLAGFQKAVLHKTASDPAPI
jgi:hypothetical protein